MYNMQQFMIGASKTFISTFLSKKNLAKFTTFSHLKECPGVVLLTFVPAAMQHIIAFHCRLEGVHFQVHTALEGTHTTLHNSLVHIRVYIHCRRWETALLQCSTVKIISQGNARYTGEYWERILREHTGEYWEKILREYTGEYWVRILREHTGEY